MIDFLKENKMLAGILIGGVVLVGGYFAFFSGGGSSTLLTASSGTQTSQVSKELLATIGDLKSITLDTSIFTDTAFLSLVDFHVDIPLQPVGRSNPFSPLIGGVRTSGPVGIPGR